MHKYIHSTNACVCIDISLKLAAVWRKERGRGWEWGGKEQCRAEKLNTEEPATSWGVMKHHHLKLTQLFDCECQSTTPPHPQPLAQTPLLAASTRVSCQPQTHHFPKGAQPQMMHCKWGAMDALTPGETYRWGIPHKSKWQRERRKKNCSRSNRRIAMFSRCCVCCGFSH